MYATLLNAGFGFILGLVPLITGIVRRSFKFGILGFVLSTVGGAILGLILAVPISAIFTWLIFRGPKPGVDNHPSESPIN